MTDYLGQVTRQLAGWLAEQVARARVRAPPVLNYPSPGSARSREDFWPAARRAMGRPAHTPEGGGGTRKHKEPWAREASGQPCRCSPPQPPPHCAAGHAAPACAQEVESPPDGGATGPIFRCAYALIALDDSPIQMEDLGPVARRALRDPLTPLE
eukprot:SM000278S10017  [mRNA]  locus=s278:18309:25667:- [translate_table: standard]